MTLQNLIGLSLKKVRTLNSGNIYTGGGFTCLLKPVNREYSGTNKKPLYYLNSIQNKHSTYLSGLFSTNDKSVFSADFKDDLGMKHLVKIRFADSGETMEVGNV